MALTLMNPILTASLVPVSVLLVEGLNAEISSSPVNLPEGRAGLVAPGSSLPAPVRWFETNAPCRPFLRLTLSGLGSSVLHEEFREAVRLSFESALLGAVPASRAADTLWWALAIDFFHKIPGASRPQVDAEGGTLEFLVPEGELARVDPISLPQRLRMIEGFLGGVTLCESSGGFLRIRIPRLGFLEGAANTAMTGSPHLGLGSVMRWGYITGEARRDAINDAHLNGEAPIGLPTAMIHLSHAREEVHPFLFAAHDLYHAIRVATLAAPLRIMAGGLYRSVNVLDPLLKALPFVDPMLNVLADKDFQVGTTDELLDGAFLPFRDEVRRARSEGRLGPTEAALFRRFLEESHAGWEPFIHESRKDYVASFVKNVGAPINN
jgi:hypothetical protein